MTAALSLMMPNAQGRTKAARPYVCARTQSGKWSTAAAVSGRRGERAGGTPARMRTHGRHAPSSLPCSLTPSLPCPRFQFRSFPRTQELLNSAAAFRLPISEQKVGQSCFCFSVCRMLRFRRRCIASKAHRRKIVPDPRGDFYAIARQSGLKLTAVSLSASLLLCERLRCQLHLLRLLQPNSSRTVSKGVSEFKARLIACFAVP